MVVQSSHWNVTVQGSGRPLEKGHVFASNGRHYIALFKSQIRVYFLSTRQCIRTIKTPDLSSVAGSVLSKSNGSILYVILTTGEVLVTNWKDKGKSPILGTFNLNIPDGTSIVSVCDILNSDYEHEEFLMVVGKISNNRSPHTRTILRAGRSDSTELFTAKNITIFASSNNCKRFVFLSSKNELIYVRLEQDQNIAKNEKVTFAYKTPITAMAVSNEDGIVALGTSSGIIQIVYAEDPETPQRLLKWHIDQVKSLRFSKDDSYLLSGGLEKVLVFWQLDTDRQQFLPRLNGAIEEVSIEQTEGELYSVKVSLNDSQDLELLILSAVDLTSRLNVTGLRPRFATPLANLEKSRKRLLKLKAPLEDATMIKNDFTAPFEVHPISKLVYTPYGSQIQAFDIAKNEQAFVQDVAFAIQAGKVRTENLIADPSVDLLSFTKDGKWMCTFDSLPTPELDNLLSSKEVKYALKFWKYVDNPQGKDNTQGQWELSTKVVDPHGPQTAVVGVIPAPIAYSDGQGFLTVDNRGGVRIWRPRVPKDVYVKAGVVTKNEKLQQTTWSLRKVKHGNGKHQSNSVSVSWSQDGSLIALGHETSVVLIDMNTMQELDSPRMPSLAGSRVRWIGFLQDNLVVLSKDRLITFDLSTFENNKLALAFSSCAGGSNLIALSEDKDLIAVAINHYTENYDIQSSILFFSPGSLNPVFTGSHNVAIASLRYSTAHECFVFLDTDARVGTISTTTTLLEELDSVTSEIDHAYEMNVLLQNARAVSSTTYNGRDFGDLSGLTPKVLNPQSFDAVLQNTEGLKLEALFESVMRVI
ncbi:unnamed protein product [Kuraishia capsulata CBS 1993]|uniref:Uncharacterized protein n=1 Tax=Kuraishia capsulata CBS 1993 TaxID=1382522 RepID=W6MSY5_9ASCO|nr:uncharacterized protein KUCA_T00005466001 [Kuraishia capsulata CBS 1993]CDK29478.1 unnamed protein product [Kuraishia capsulata CBS 1993]